MILEHIKSAQDVSTIGHGQWHGFEHGGVNYLIEAKETALISDVCVDSRIYTWNETAEEYQLETVSLKNCLSSWERAVTMYPSLTFILSVDLICKNLD